jgi:hypothetical protein
MMRGPSRLNMDGKNPVHNRTVASDPNPGRKIFDRQPEDPKARKNEIETDGRQAETRDRAYVDVT